jgi:hypothetical protein
VIEWRRGDVASLRRSWRGVQELRVTLDDGDEIPALSYPLLTGEVAVGDEVLLNVSAYERRLGTGGFALVVASPTEVRAGARPPDAAPGPGHLVKARYSPSQAMVLGVDEQESPHHALLRDADSLDGTPVVVADLHSSLPAVVAGARWAAADAGRPAPTVAYVMTDGGALPAWFSRTADGLRQAGWLTATITTGQSFGGDLEAVSVHSGLLAAHLVAAADLVVVTQGPGNLGTGTRWGFSGVSAGEAVNAAATLGGRPVAALRVSGADERTRHRGLSHHSTTAYGRVALAAADVVVPRVTELLPTFDAGLERLHEEVREAASALARTPAGHRLVEVTVTPGLVAALQASPVQLSTMGRTLAQDPAAFYTAAAAGAHAARLLGG